MMIHSSSLWCVGRELAFFFSSRLPLKKFTAYLIFLILSINPKFLQWRSNLDDESEGVYHFQPFWLEQPNSHLKTIRGICLSILFPKISLFERTVMICKGHSAE